MQKKVFILLIICIFMSFMNVNATGGNLKKSSIKTCPDGKTYGKHSDGKGKEHWHVAITNGNSYFAFGDSILEDPCPGYTTNEGTAEEAKSKEKTVDNSDEVSTQEENSKSNNSKSNREEVVEEEKEETEINNNAISIKSIKLDGKVINEISDIIEYITDKKTIKIEIVPMDDKTTFKISGDQNHLSSDKVNTFEIELTGEDGSKRVYTLNVKRKASKSDVKITKLKVNNSEVKFDKKKKGSKFFFHWHNSASITYELSDKKATLAIYKNNVEVKGKIKIKQGNNNFKFVVKDRYGDTNTYNLKIKKLSKNGSVLILSFITTLLIIIPSILIILLITNKKRRNLYE